MIDWKGGAVKVTAPTDVFIPALADGAHGGFIAEGDEVETTAAIGRELVAQGWTEAKTGKTNKTEKD